MKIKTHKDWTALRVKLENGQKPHFTSYRLPIRVAGIISTHAKKAGTSLTDAVLQILADFVQKNPAKPDPAIKSSKHARDPYEKKPKKSAKAAKSARKAAPRKAKAVKAKAPARKAKSAKPKAARKAKTEPKTEPAEPTMNADRQNGSAPADAAVGE